MKVFVKATAIAADTNIILPRGVVFIDEVHEPRLAKRAAVLCQKFPNDIVLYEGKEAGLDIKGSRMKELDAQADAEAEELLKKATKSKKKEEKKEVEEVKEKKKNAPNRAK